MTETGKAVLKYVVQAYSRGSIGYEDLIVLIECCGGKNNVVELGTNIGTTTRLLSMMCGGVYTVDIFEDTHLIEDAQQREVYKNTFDKNKHTFEAISRSLADRDNIIVIKQQSDKAAAMFGDSSIDAIFIDADHSKDGVRKDYEAWFSKVNSLFLFHDMVPAFGCYQFYNEALVIDERIQEIPHNYTGSSIKIFQKRAK